jgi:hypothetical protein
MRYRVSTKKISGFSGREEVCVRSQSGAGWSIEVMKTPRLETTH